MEQRQRVIENIERKYKETQMKTKNVFDTLINAEALWVYRYMKQTGQEVNDMFPSAKISAFKTLCIEEGDYKFKDDTDTETNTQYSRGLYHE